VNEKSEIVKKNLELFVDIFSSLQKEYLRIRFCNSRVSVIIFAVLRGVVRFNRIRHTSNRTTGAVRVSSD